MLVLFGLFQSRFRLGIPVFHSMRPAAAPGLNTVTSGKGVTTLAARVSAMMEAIERTWCEPPPGELTRASYSDLCQAGVPVLDPRRLILRRGHTWTEGAPLGWWPVRELLTAFNQVAAHPVEAREAPRRPGDVAGAFTRVARAERLLGWQARYDLTEGIRHSLQWAAIRDKMLSDETPAGPVSRPSR